MAQPLTVEAASLALAELPRRLRRAAAAGFRAGLDDTVRLIKSRFFRSGGRPSPEYIINRSGRLQRSIKRVGPSETEGLVWGGVSMSGPQAAILEYGGRTRPHLIRPRRASVLRWFDSTGRPIFARRVRHPGSRIEARAPLARGLESNLPEILNAIRAEVAKVQLAGERSA